MSESFNRALRAAARRSRPAGVCPDAAMLAAYADNGLSADERRIVETHAADCATCLEHLALLGAVSLDREAPAAVTIVARALGMAGAGGHGRPGRRRVGSPP